MKTNTQTSAGQKVPSALESPRGVVLLNPPAEVIREPAYDEPCRPSIGIAYVGSYLWRHTGIRPHVIDSRLGRLSLQETIDQIIALRPRILGISAMTHMIVTSGKIARAVKEALPDTIVIVGGFHASFLPERTLREFPQFDLVVVGEGEIAFSELVQAILSGEPYDSISGLGFRKDGEVQLNGRGEIPDHLDELGAPLWELFPKEHIERHATIFPIMSQRGCPFHCNFCSRPYGNTVRARSVKSITDEMEYNIFNFGAQEMHFYDETFTVNKKRTAELCDAMIEKGLNTKLKWASMVHANTITPDLLAKMRIAGCSNLGFGVESGDEDIIKMMKKGITKERTLRAGDMLRQSGIEWAAYFIFGHPSETHESCKATIKFATKLNGDVTCFGVMVPYPGTEVWEMAIRGQGGYKIISDNWEDFNKQIGKALELEGLTRKQLERYQLEGYLKVYLFNWRFKELFEVLYEHRKRLYYKLKQFVTPRRRGVEQQLSETTAGADQ